jgi:hypothetical protein
MSMFHFVGSIRLLLHELGIDGGFVIDADSCCDVIDTD